MNPVRESGTSLSFSLFQVLNRRRHGSSKVVVWSLPTPQGALQGGFPEPAAPSGFWAACRLKGLHLSASWGFGTHIQVFDGGTVSHTEKRRLMLAVGLVRNTRGLSASVMQTDMHYIPESQHCLFGFALTPHSGLIWLFFWKCSPSSSAVPGFKIALTRVNILLREFKKGWGQYLHNWVAYDQTVMCFVVVLRSLDLCVRHILVFCISGTELFLMFTKGLYVFDRTEHTNPSSITILSAKKR